MSQAGGRPITPEKKAVHAGELRGLGHLRTTSLYDPGANRVPLKRD